MIPQKQVNVNQRRIHNKVKTSINPEIYRIIRESADIEDAAGRYGLEIRNRKARCPFHNDRTPSMSFKDGRFKCFGCGRSGDITDLVSGLLGISLRDAAKRLNADYDLGLDLEGTVSAEVCTRNTEAKAFRAAWKERETQITDAMWHYAEKRRREEGWMDSESAYLIEEWEYAKENRRMELYIDWKEEIKRIERYCEENCG